VNNFARDQKYGEKQKGDAELTSGTTKSMAISSREEGGIEHSEDRWRRSLSEFLSFWNSAAARKVGLRMQNDKMEEEYRRKKYL